MKTRFVTVCLIFLLSCKKDDGSKPTVTITSPTNQQTFTSGQTVNVTATVADDGELHSIMLMIMNKNGGTNVLHFEDHVDVKSYNLNQSFTVQPGGVYSIEVSGEDHGGNKTTSTVEVSTQ